MKSVKEYKALDKQFSEDLKAVNKDIEQLNNSVEKLRLNIGSISDDVKAKQAYKELKELEQDLEIKQMQKEKLVKSNNEQLTQLKGAIRKEYQKLDREYSQKVSNSIDKIQKAKQDYNDLVMNELEYRKELYQEFNQALASYIDIMYQHEKKAGQLRSKRKSLKSDDLKIFVTHNNISGNKLSKVI